MNGNEPAFGAQDVYAHPEEILEHKGSPGLTKRELFAAMAMQGMLNGCVGTVGSSQEITAYAKGHCNAAVAERAVVMADALIKQLSEPAK